MPSLIGIICKIFTSLCGKWKYTEALWSHYRNMKCLVKWWVREADSCTLTSKTYILPNVQQDTFKGLKGLSLLLGLAIVYSLNKWQNHKKMLLERKDKNAQEQQSSSIAFFILSCWMNSNQHFWALGSLVWYSYWTYKNFKLWLPPCLCHRASFTLVVTKRHF